jgi:hypothetical protein
MAVSKVAFTAVGLACIAAAGAGGYLALRQSVAPEPAAPSAAAAPVTTPADASPAASAARPVQETEAVVAPPSKAATTAKKAAAAAKPAKQPEKVIAQTQTAGAPKLLPPALVATAPLPPPPPPPPAPLPAPLERIAQEPPPPPAAPQHTFDELVISTDSVIGLQSDTTVTSERARVEDRVEGRVTRDVKVADRVAIPAGSRAIGYVTQVERGGKFKEQAKLAIRFQTIVLADGTRLPISTAAVEREGDAKGNSSAAKVGGAAVAGTILGAILGGGKGAAVGGLAGAGAGAAATQAGDRSVATLRAGEPITIRLLSPVTVTTESK